MRKVFFDGLPRKRRGVSWMETKGVSLSFIYDEVSGVLKVTDCQRINGKTYLWVSYTEGNPIQISADSIAKGKIGHIVKPKTDRYKVGEIVQGSDCSFLVLSPSFPNKQLKKCYSCKCQKCKNVLVIRERLLDEHGGCPACGDSPRVLIEGFNDMATTAPWMIDYLLDKEDATKYFKSSAKKIMFKCPQCGETKPLSINNVNRKGFSCELCGDGISYGEKFVYKMFHQLGLDVVKQYSPEWANEKRYDFYLPSRNAIVEVHGRQHYPEEMCWHDYDVAKTQENDLAKRELAYNHGISYYYEVNCKRSSPSWIKNSLTQELGDDFLIDSVDWEECHMFAVSNLDYEVTQMYQTGEYTMKEIADALGLGYSTVVKYITRFKDVKELKRT